MKKLMIFLIILTVAVGSAFAGDAFGLSAGWEKASAFGETAVIGMRLGPLGVDLNVGLVGYGFADPEITLSGEMYENGSLVDEFSEDVEIPDTLSLSTTGVILGLGPYIDIYEKNNMTLQAQLQFNMLIINAAFELEDSGDDYTDTYTANATALGFEFVPAVGAELQPIKDVPFFLSAAVGLSVAFLPTVNGELNLTYEDNLGSEEIDYSAEVNPGVWSVKTLLLLGGRYEFF